jgi:hypothetical protein
MKILTIILVAAALAGAQNQSAQAQSAQAQGGQDKSGAPARAAAKSPDAGAPALPAGATEVEPNLYRYTDAQGKTWMYRRTPFDRRLSSRWRRASMPRK